MIDAPLATYRLQFNRDFPLDDAKALVPYFNRLGVTHVYASPVLKPRSGSQHGYDVVDPKTANPELGGGAAFRELAETLKAHGLGLILDIVPNHMAASVENPYWKNVLTYGSASRFSRWFDIDWRQPDSKMWGRVLLPVLGEPLPRILRAGQIGVAWRDGRFVLTYYEHAFPIDPATLPAVLQHGRGAFIECVGAEHPSIVEFAAIIETFRALPHGAARTRRRDDFPVDETEQTLAQLARVVEMSPALHDWAERTAARFGEGEPGRERLKKLIGRQSYRLVFWRAAARAINYRRFFDINSLVSIRQEDPDVWEQTHSLVLQWLKDGLLDGLRIDHIDGLRDPAAYLRRLREAASSFDRKPAIFVEKILGPHERLREDWPVDGTTGYDVLNRIEDVLISPAGFAEIEDDYLKLTRRRADFDEIVSWGKRRVLKADLSAYVGQLANLLQRFAHNRDEGGPGIGLRDAVNAIVETIVALPVYRTYVTADAQHVTQADRRWLEPALDAAAEKAGVETAAVGLLRQVLLLQSDEPFGDDELRDRLHFIERFQQITGPATAKGVEDTALYAYAPLASRNEVGGGPEASLDASIDRLHEDLARRAESSPRDMLCATTHDTKRNADVRARIDVLSEIPEEWRRTWSRWRSWNRPLRVQVGRRYLPDAATEYLFYQTVLGIWPVAAAQPPLEELRGRLWDYMLKAVREAKTNTSWVDGNVDYENALKQFIDQTLSNDSEIGGRFVADVARFAARIARPGYWNSLSRTAIQYMAPGTPDLYQGDELWNFALVDPDNRRPVDYEHRRALLDEVVARAERSADDRLALARELAAAPDDGRIKLYLLHTLLQLRRTHAELFAAGKYVPLRATGPRADHVFAFARVSESAAAICIAPRLTVALSTDAARPPIGDVWNETVLVLPAVFRNTAWTAILTGGACHAANGGDLVSIPASSALPDYPVAVLLSRRPDPATADST